MCPELRNNPPTIEFLKQHLSLQDLKFQALAGDASARRYVRVYNAQGSYILMILPESELKSGQNFLDIRKLYEKHKVYVPSLIASDFDLGYILTEDLGDLTLERRFWESQDHLKSAPFYVKSLNEIIKIHSIPIDLNDSSPCFHLRFDHEKLLWEMNYMKRNLLEDFFALDMKASEKEALVLDFSNICEHLASLDPVVCHRDYHSRNIMLHKNETYVIDFQDSRLGPRHYDLVSLLRDSYVRLEASMEDELLKYYFEKTQSLHQESWQDFKRNYDIQILQRCLKACGSFSSFYNKKGDTRYLKYIQPTLKKVQDTLFQMDGFEALKRLYTEHKVAEKACKV